MNYLYLLIEVIMVFLLMILFYRVGKKEGLFIYIALMSSILSIVMFKVFDILSFQINFGLPSVMGIFTANNIIKINLYLRLIFINNFYVRPNLF